MIVRDLIKECKVAQGDLVFIYHKTKPFKTGWWRKIREGSSGSNKIYYVLEKPMHKDFNIVQAGIKSHVEKGLCIMMNNTLREGVDENKYEILADIRGVDSVFLSSKGYGFNYIDKTITLDEDKENVIITIRFKELMKLYKPIKNKTSDLETLVKGLI